MLAPFSLEYIKLVSIPNVFLLNNTIAGIFLHIHSFTLGTHPYFKGRPVEVLEDCDACTTSGGRDWERLNGEPGEVRAGECGHVEGRVYMSSREATFPLNFRRSISKRVWREHFGEGRWFSPSSSQRQSGQPFLGAARLRAKVVSITEDQNPNKDSWDF